MVIYEAEKKVCVNFQVGHVGFPLRPEADLRQFSSAATKSSRTRGRRTYVAIKEANYLIQK